MVAGLKDIVGDFVLNNRTLGNLGDDYTVVYTYGFWFSYGIGFGFPLLLGLPEETKGINWFYAKNNNNQNNPQQNEKIGFIYFWIGNI